MKKILLSLALALPAVFAFAQDVTSRRPNVIAQDGNNHFYIFEATDENGEYGIFFSVGQTFPIFKYETERSKTTINHSDRASILIGQSYDDVMPFLDNLLSLADSELGASEQFPARYSPSILRQGPPVTVTCVLGKPFLKRPRLVFMFQDRERLIQVEMTKWTINVLRDSYASFYNRQANR